ncbi:hypothetical protein J1614_006896 [Plenodomus biglobosus]|nr:hypothetical protein J1614_006896 [Plenodomus biglobosus]
MLVSQPFDHMKDETTVTPRIESSESSDAIELEYCGNLNLLTPGGNLMVREGFNISSVTTLRSTCADYTTADVRHCAA